MAEHDQEDGGIVVETVTKRKLKRPPRYRVLLHNDDYTTREFVIFVLMRVFHHDEPKAVQTMLHVHNSGVGVAGIYTREVAETKIETVEQLARQQEFPLQLSMEPEDDDNEE